MVETGNEGGLSNPLTRTSSKGTYISPRLVEYGSVAKLTQSGQGSGSDGGAIAGMMMVCL